MFVNLVEKNISRSNEEVRPHFLIFSIVMLHGLFSFHLISFHIRPSLQNEVFRVFVFRTRPENKTQFSVKCINNGFPMQVSMKLSQSDRRNRI